MARKRRRFTPEFKARVALEALRERDSPQAIATRHELHPNQVSAPADVSHMAMRSSASWHRRRSPTFRLGTPRPFATTLWQRAPSVVDRYTDGLAGRGLMISFSLRVLPNCLYGLTARIAILRRRSGTQRNSALSMMLRTGRCDSA